MRAKHRCKEQVHGDRCVKERGHDTFAAERDFLHKGHFREWGRTQDGKAVDRELFPSSYREGRLQDRFLDRLELTGAHLRCAVLGSDEEKGKLKLALNEIIKAGTR